MSNSFKRVVVIGAGTMGGGIAAVVANAGIPVYRLDIAANDLSVNSETDGLQLKIRTCAIAL